MTHARRERTPQRSALIAVTATLVALLSAAGRTQEAAPCPDPCLTLLTVGGLLGYLDGVPEPSITGDPATHRGGLLGVSMWVRAHRPGDAVLLMTGNNQPQELHALTPAERRSPAAPAAHWFWKEVAALRPDAIAVGNEDLQRWLLQMEPQVLVRWVRAAVADRLPFVASNVIIRKSGSRVNIVRDPRTDTVLRIAPNESVGPLRSLDFSHRCALAREIDAARVRFDEPDAPEIVVPPPGARVARRIQGGECRTRVALKTALAPGRTYHLRVGDPVAPTFRFRLTTHDVLTPHASPGPWRGVPVAIREQEGIPLAVMAFVSSDLAAEIPASFSRWTREEGCSEDVCRIEYLPAREAAEWWQSVGSAEGGLERFLVILADVGGDEVDELLNEVPEARVMVIPPVSLRLGRTIGTERPGTGDHDLGPPNIGAVIDSQLPRHARVVVRPERLGQTVVVTRGHVGPDASSNVHLSLTGTTVSSEHVRGGRLQAEVDEARGEARYRAVLDAHTQVDPRRYDVYCPLDAAGPFDASGQAQGRLWTSGGDFAALVLDEMRRALDADISLVPSSWIEGDVLAWLQEARSGPRRVNWLSGFILQRVLYRAGRIVRVSIDDSDLRSTLSRLFSTARQAGVPICASGLGFAGDCPASDVDLADLTVNLRPIYFGHSYSVALPDSLARASGLRLQGARTLREILRPLDRRLAACPGRTLSEPARADPRPLAMRLEDALAERPQQFLRLDPVSFAYNVTDVGEPSGAAGVFGNLATDSSEARDNRQVVLDAIADFSPYDTRRWMIHVPAEIRFARRELESSTSFDANTFSVGLRGDFKQLPFGGRRAIAFGGLFLEGDVSDTRTRVRATRRVPSAPDPPNLEDPPRNVSVPGPVLTFVTRRALFWFGTVGAELPTLVLGQRRPTSARLTLSLDMGRALNVPLAVRVGDAAFDIERFIRVGPAGVLRAAFEADADGVTATTPFGFTYGSEDRFRLELDTRTDTRFDAGLLRTYNRFRWYNQSGDDPPLSPRWSWRGRVAWQATWWNDWVLAPYVDVTVVHAVNLDGVFSVARGGVALQLQSYWRKGSGAELD